MGKKRYWNSEAKNSRWIKEGRGQGIGKDYKPWITRTIPEKNGCLTSKDLQDCLF